MLKHEEELTEKLILSMSSLKNAKLYLPANRKVLGIVSLNIDGYSASDVGMILYDDYEICVRTGYHCAPFVHDFISSHEHLGTVRISIGAFNKDEDILKIAEAIETL